MTRILSALFLLVLAAATPAFADGRGTPDEAKAMALEAAEFLRANGPEVAFQAFNDDPAWKDRDLYVYVFENNGVMVAHGAMPTLIGRDLSDMRDVDGRLLTQDILAVETEGWVEYKWRNPTSNAVEPKTAYAIRVGNYTVGVGAYL